jgi:hypothetical protein
MDRAYRPRLFGALLATVVLAAPLPVASQPPASGPVALALAGAIAARSDERHTSFNPAADPQARRLLAGCAVAAGGLAGLTDGALSIETPIDSLRSISSSLGGVAYGAYRLVELRASFGSRIGERLIAGTALRVEAQSIDGYGTSAALLLDAGVTARLFESLALAVVARNMTGAGLRGIPRPQQLAVGALVALGDSIDLSIDLLHEAGRGVSVACGASFPIAERLVARAGMRIDGSLVGAGFGYEDDSITVDVAMAWIDALGAQLAAGVGTRW